MALVPIPIDGLPAATLPLTGTELIPMMQGGATVQTEAENWPFDYPATGAVVRTMYAKMADMLSIKDFGAVGDGIADDYPAIQAAIDAVATQGGGTVYFPVGNFRITAPLVIDSNFTLLRGSGSSAGGTQITYPPNLDCIKIRALRGCGVREMKLQPASTATNGTAINCLAADGFSVQSYMRFDSVNFSGCWIGLAVWPNMTNAIVTNCAFLSNITIAALVGNIVGTGGGGFLFQGCSFDNPTGTPTHIRFDTCTQARVIGCNFTGGSRQISVAPQSPTTATSGLTVTGCTFAAYTQYGVIIQSGGSIALTMIAIVGNVFLSTASVNGAAVYCDFNSSSGHVSITGNMIQLAGTLEYGVLIQNGYTIAVTANAFHGAAGLSAAAVWLSTFTDTILVSSNSFANFVKAVDNGSAGNQILAVSNVDNFGVLNVNPSGGVCTLPDWGFFINVQGSSSFSSVQKVNQVGRMVVLKFETGGSTVSASATLKIGANFVTTVNDTLTLVCDGAKWYEVARSVNAA